MKRKQIIWIIIISILSLCYISTLCFHILKLERASKIGVNLGVSDSPQKINKGWHFKWGDSPLDSSGNFLWLSEKYEASSWESFNYPGKPSNPQKSRIIWITAKIPEGNWKTPAITFRAPQQALEVYVEGKLIYSFGRMDFTNTKSIPGSIWHFVTLPEGSKGKNIYFRTYAPTEFLAGYLIDIEVGERSGLVLNILKRDSKSLIFGILYVFIGLVAFFLMFMRSGYKKILFSLGMFCVSIGFWCIAEGKILQLFFPLSVVPIYVANISVFIMPIGFIYFIQLVFTEEGQLENKILKLLWQSYIVLTAITFLLDMLKIKSSIEMDVYLHILISISILPLLHVIIKSAVKGNKDALIFLGGLAALCFTTLYDIYIMFYVTSPDVNPNRITEYGMFVTVLSLVGIMGRRVSLLYGQLKVNLIENETNYKSLFKNMTDGFIYTKILRSSDNTPTDCIIVDINPAFLANSGMEREQIIGMKLSSILPEWKISGFGNNKAEEEIAAASECPQVNDLLQLWGNWYKASSFSPKDGYISIILSDITEIKNAENIIRRQAYTDGMTGFYNRTYFEEAMIKIGSSYESLKPISFISIDIDGLKITNDTFGHKVGDELLLEASKIISDVFGSKGILARVGGDEFCVILPETGYKAAVAKKDAIVQKIEEANLKNPVVPISMSIGIATSSDPSSEDIYSIYRRADDEMYQYKLSQTGSEKSKLIEMLLTALSERDYVAHGHVERLTQMSESMADILGLQDTEKRNLVLLAKVHDLGKIGMTDKILLKSGKLSKEEYEVMKLHSKIGYNIANRSRELVHIANLILHHHERWDGNGYPEGLKAESIPLECRILGIIDAYDAMTSMRPYHKGITKKEALLEIKRCSGTQFDPVIAEKFIEMLAD